MSVLVRDKETNKVYSFIKGAPERIFKNSVNKPEHYEETLEDLSMGGYRTIAMGYKEVGKDEMSEYLGIDRTIYEREIRLIGVLAFENKVKEEAKETMERLRQSNIETKIITGDNIYIAVETAIRSGILEEGSRVIILEGKEQEPEKRENENKEKKIDNEKGKSRTFKGKLLERKGNEIIKREVRLR